MSTMAAAAVTDAYRERLHGMWGSWMPTTAPRGATWSTGSGSMRRRRQRQQCRWLHDLDLPDQCGSIGAYLVQCWRQSLWRQRPESLARDTHKFESRYLDWLIAPSTAENGEILSRALGSQRRPAVGAGRFLPGRRGPDRAARADRTDGHGAAPRSPRNTCCSRASSTASAKLQISAGRWTPSSIFRHPGLSTRRPT